MREREQEEAVEILAKDFEQQTGIGEFDLSGTAHVFDTNRKDNTCPACGFVFSDSIAICPDCGLALGAVQ